MCSTISLTDLSSKRFLKYSVYFVGFALGQSIIATSGFNAFIISACLIASSQLRFRVVEFNAASISFGSDIVILYSKFSLRCLSNFNLFLWGRVLNL